MTKEDLATSHEFKRINELHVYLSEDGQRVGVELETFDGEAFRGFVRREQAQELGNGLLTASAGHRVLSPEVETIQ